jgi:hypothetical protein
MQGARLEFTDLAHQFGFTDSNRGV